MRTEYIIIIVAEMILMLLFILMIIFWKKIFNFQKIIIPKQTLSFYINDLNYYFRKKYYNCQSNLSSVASNSKRFRRSWFCFVKN